MLAVPSPPSSGSVKPLPEGAAALRIVRQVAATVTQLSSLLAAVQHSPLRRRRGRTWTSSSWRQPDPQPRTSTAANYRNCGKWSFFFIVLFGSIARTKLGYRPFKLQWSLNSPRVLTLRKTHFYHRTYVWVLHASAISLTHVNGLAFIKKKGSVFAVGNKFGRPVCRWENNIKMDV